MTNLAKRHLWAIAALAIAPFLLAPSCEDLSPLLVIDAPIHGSFTTEDNVLVTGTLFNVHPSAPVEVTVNGYAAAVVGGKFSILLPLDLANPVQPIVVEALVGEQKDLLRKRVTLIRGDSIASGEASPDGFAMRMRDPGMDDVEPVIADLIGLDPAIFVPPGSVVVDDFCYLRGIFGTCLGRVKAVVAASPAPKMTGITANIDSRGGALGTGYLDVDVTIEGLTLRADVGETSGININCHADIASDVMRVRGRFALGPDASGGIDAQQMGSVSVEIGAFHDSTDCDGLLGGLYEVMMDLVISDLKNDFVLPGMSEYLNTTVNGDTVIANALEMVLADLDINGAVGDAIGVVEVDAPISSIEEDEDGFTVAAGAIFSPVVDDPNAVDLPRSYHVYEPFPSFGPTAPNGQPYELGLGISASGFNQLMKGMIETGLLIMSVDKIDFLGQTDVEITAGDLSIIFPQLRELDSAAKIRIDVYPTMAPFVTGEPGPQGELATLTLPHLLLSIVTDADNALVLKLALDAKLGFDATFDDGILKILMAEPQDGELSFTVLDNPYGVLDESVHNIFPAVAKPLVPTLASALGSFPLPDFLGLELGLVDLTRNGEYMSLFFDLSVRPPNFGPPTECGFLRGGEGLAAGESLYSCDGRFRLLMQQDGNFVLYDEVGTALWNSVSAGSPAEFAIMQTDGNLVLYDVASTPYWHTITAGNPGAYLNLRNDGSLAIYRADGAVLWSGAP